MQLHASLEPYSEFTYSRAIIHPSIDQNAKTVVINAPTFND
jgi:hypothetical protein